MIEDSIKLFAESLNSANKAEKSLLGVIGWILLATHTKLKYAKELSSG